MPLVAGEAEWQAGVRNDLERVLGQVGLDCVGCCEDEAGLGVRGRQLCRNMEEHEMKLDSAPNVKYQVILSECVGRNMEQCACVERELEKVLHRFVMYGHQSEERLDELLRSVCEIRAQLVAFGVQDADLSVLSQTMTQCCKNIKETVQMLASRHKDIHGSVSKVGKAIDRNFDAEISAVVAETVWDTPDRQKYLSETIVEHLYRQGMLSVAEDLCQESGVVIDMSMKQPFLELNRILEALRMQDLRPALEWALAQWRDQQSGGSFAICKTFSTIRFTAPERYTDFDGESSVLAPWDACALLGLSVESPLSVSFASGCMALPVLMNIKQVIEQRQCSGVWTHKDELPIEIDLGKKCWYHSVFACPILRQQTSESNPPMKLICGHVISRDALNKLTNAGKLKCPYCPMEQNPSHAKQIYF
uniref:RING-Gid-type domain-containing protein n=1 Tax=Knipowitschia caucasica TaxID=637954 RepID=A0AAV2MJM0_KNICA